MKLHPQVHAIRQMVIFQYLIEDPNGLILIDAGVKGSGKNILKTVGSLGGTSMTIRKILITHADADHYGGVNELRKTSEAVVCASQKEAEAMRIGKSSRPLTPHGMERILYWLTGNLFHAGPTLVDEHLKPGAILPVLGGLEILDTQGHTPEHLSFYSRSEGILFAGDSIDLMSGKPLPSKGANTWNEAIARKAFEFQMDLKPRLICAGHGHITLG